MKYEHLLQHGPSASIFFIYIPYAEQVKEIVMLYSVR